MNVSEKFITMLEVSVAKKGIETVKKGVEWVKKEARS